MCVSLSHTSMHGPTRDAGREERLDKLLANMAMHNVDPKEYEWCVKHRVKLSRCADERRPYAPSMQIFVSFLTKYVILLLGTRTCGDMAQ